ncbi:MAG: guanylate kinase [Flavobacteriales bacterium]|nr:guanylate kinase [Flavobacteriales bacterium]MBL0046268.1 guanylate kinase [Flavobacteriales bacterium]
MTSPDGKCIIVSAPSGAGKTTLVRHLLMQEATLAFSVSATSRAKRDYEVDGVDYFFLGADEFRRRIEADEFVEWEEVYPGQFYGTLKHELRRIWNTGKHPVFDVDVVGGLDLKEIFGPNALALFVAPPSINALEQRLRNRGTETEDSLKKRVAKAHHELTFANQFDAVVVNDDLDRACSEAFRKVSDFLNGSLTNAPSASTP